MPSFERSRIFLTFSQNDPLIVRNRIHKNDAQSATCTGFFKVRVQTMHIQSSETSVIKSILYPRGAAAMFLLVLLIAESVEQK